MTEREPMEFNDFRVVTSSSVSRKASTVGGVVASGGQPSSSRYRYTLGDVCSTNITLDVNVGTGWTRIRLKEVPKFIVHAFNMISKFGLETDGIFRKEGNSARLNRAMVQNIYQGQCDIPNDYTVIDVCTLVKRFLRDLKPPLLDSDEFRQRLFKKACQARISNCFVLTRDEMADMCYTDDRTKERQTALLSDIHFSTLGYVMRQLNRISAHCESHKMSIENLAVVLVGSVFGDGIHNTTKKSNQIRRGSQDDILAQKKQDMNVHVAAVKLLITNANLIGVRRDPYVTSNAMLRSSSAMPRCMSSGYETASSDADCVSSRTATLKSSDGSLIHRRDSEAAHKIVTSRKKNEQLTKKKRSASFLPSFRDIRHRLTNMKRAKSPSPERLMTGGQEPTSSKQSDTTSSSDQNSAEPQLIHRKKVARNESNTMSTGSTASGRQSRSQQARRGNTNAAPRGLSSSKPTISKLFDGDMPVSSGALRRLSASDQNSDAIRFANHRLSSNEQMSVTEFLMSEHERDNKETVPSITSTSNISSRIQKRNTMILGETSKTSTTKHTNRRHTAPINNNRLRRNRPNTVGAGLPQNRRDTLTGSSSLEEKENQADCETDDTLEQALLAEQSKWLLEQKAMEARSRRAGRKQKVAAMRNVSTDSLMVLNGSMAATESSASIMKAAEPLEVLEESPKKVEKVEPVVVLRKDLEEVKKKQFCDMATSPMVLDTPKKSPILASHENGHVWVGTKQVITVTPSPNLVRRTSRARLSYSKANESQLEMPSSSTTPSPKIPREASPLMSMSPVMRHVTIHNNSPPGQMVSGTARTSTTPKLSPLVLKLDKSSPPPVPPHSPPTLTPQTSKSSIPKDLHHPRRPPTPPSHPKMSNPFSPKLPIRSVTVDNGMELPAAAFAPPGLFKLPQLPKKISGAQLSPLARQPQSLSTLSVPNRGNLRETKSIDTVDTVPLRSAPLTSSRPPSGQLSPRSSEFFEFGKYTNILKSAKDEFALPMRKQSVEPRPSVAIIRSNNCGLVRSRVNHFQEIEQMQRNETSMSGRASALSQLSLRSSDTHPSSDRYSDFSDSRHNLTSSESMDSPSTPIASNSRASLDPVLHHF